MTSAKINEEWCYPPRGFDVFNRRIDPQCVSTHCALLWLYYWPKCCSIILNETIKWRRKIPRSDQLSVKSTFKVICSTSCARCDTITYEDADKDANEIEINHDNKLIPTFWVSFHTYIYHPSHGGFHLVTTIECSAWIMSS
jgi:hypothetical protein